MLQPSGKSLFRANLPALPWVLLLLIHLIVNSIIHLLSTNYVPDLKSVLGVFKETSLRLFPHGSLLQVAVMITALNGNKILIFVTEK